MTRSRSVFAAAFLSTIATLVAPAAAVNLPPGGSVSLNGQVPPGGVILRDELIPFDIVDTNTGGLLFRATVQDRVVQLASGDLDFLRRVIDPVVNLPGAVSRITVTDFTGWTTDVDWDPNNPGQHRPTMAFRTGDGSGILYDFSSNPIVETQNSYWFYALTDSSIFSITGTMTLELTTGESTTITVATPGGDDTPPIAEIHEPSDFACLCDPAIITGIADDPDGTYVSHWLEYRAVNDPNWFLIGQSFTPVPAPGGTLFVWNLGFLPQGYYFLRLTVENLSGLTSNALTVVWVDRQFDVLNLNFPQGGSAVGGDVCIGGVLDDHCPETYHVEYAPANTLAFQPVDPNTPSYTGAKINQTFAVWDSTTVPDGDYDLRVTAFDDCGHTKVELVTVNADNTWPTAEIRTPVNCACVDGIIEITGTADDANLAGWVLQYAGGNSNSWVTIASGSNSVIDGVLGTWDTTNLVPCCYVLRLIVSDSAIIDCNGAIHHHSDFIVAVDVGDCDGGGCLGDLNGDNMVNTLDLLIMLAQWGVCLP